MTAPQLPLDILVSILHCLPPTRARHSPSVQTLLSFSIASKLLREAAALSALWEPHYRVRYRHCQREKENQRKESVDGNWQEMYAIRRHLDNEVLALVRTMINEVRARSDTTRELLDFGMDAWDVLALCVEESSILDIVENNDLEGFGSDPLTWVYWTEALAQGLAKQDAIKTWSAMIAADVPKDVLSFEESQCYTSSFYGVPCNDVMDHLHSLYERLRASLDTQGRVLDPKSAQYDLPLICRDIFRYMRSENIVCAEGPAYTQLMNKFPHSYLTNQKQTIPLSLAHVFCYLAKQTGISASPVNFPGCVLIHVPHPTKSSEAPLILNPSASHFSKIILNERDDWRSDEIFPFPVFPGPHDRLLSPCGPVEMLKRTSYNILTATARDVTSTVPQKGAGVLCSMCIGLLTLDDAMIIQSLFAMLDLSPLDSHILYKNLLPFIERDALQYQLLREHCADAFRQEHNNTLGSKRRSESASPEFFVGMGMRHAKFHYTGIIYGWDETCKQPDQWMTQMNVDGLARKRHQPFYNVLVLSENGSFSARYVAEENVTPLGINIALAIQMLQTLDGLGRHFGNVTANKGAFGRFLPSPETRRVYPDDEDYAIEWIAKHQELSQT